MKIVSEKISFKESLTLQSGDVLSGFELMTETYGELNSDKSNAILVCHAFSGNHHAAGIKDGEKKPGWWDEIIGDGKNFIPTIHVRDLARVTKKIVDDDISKDYIFAVDRTKRPTQKRLVKAISKGVGTGLVQHQDTDEISDSIIWKDFLSMNLKMKSSMVFKDKEAAEGEDIEDPAVAKRLKFPWHCEKGIV